MTARPVEPSLGWADLMAEGRLPRFILICLGVWLNAADSLVTATIMPSVGQSLGGLAYFSWATAGFLVGAILAGASAGRLAELVGLRTAMVAAGLVMTAGCAMSAAAPGITTFLVGRLVQGLGSGWISGFAMVAIATIFPERHLARVFAGVSGIWGVATLLGPALGGLLLELGDWRDVFWVFALQALGFSLAVPLLLPKPSSLSSDAPAVPWPQMVLLGFGVGMIAISDTLPDVATSIGCIMLGLAVLAVGLRVDRRAGVRLLPTDAGDTKTPVGAGYAAMFWMTAASMGFAIYAPPILQLLRGFSPLEAGYTIGVESVTWTVCAFAVAHVDGKWEDRWICGGALMLVLSLAILPVTLADGHLGFVLVGGALMGAAFGFSWSFMCRRVLAALGEAERAIGSSAITAVRQTGAAAGAALSGAAANMAGFAEGLTPYTARAAAIWVFVGVMPLALVGAWAAYRLVSRTVKT